MSRLGAFFQIFKLYLFKHLAKYQLYLLNTSLSIFDFVIGGVIEILLILLIVPLWPCFPRGLASTKFGLIGENTGWWPNWIFGSSTEISCATKIS
ncbi:hypothetical protein EEJ49_04365 [Staphylococcus pseudintermedius]|nr:hypothetical protein [Staphylococcus pseudintermedius]